MDRQASQEAPEQQKAPAAANKPGQIKVAVLNGTGECRGGACRGLRGASRNQRFPDRHRTDASETFAESVVMYTQGNEVGRENGRQSRSTSDFRADHL
ncbi:MAG: hypothetical protein IPK93_04415 [Solirubrobacterales bacterium]|nr:hypothetical protein [Solirubrobacterales bacterium]